MGRPKSETDRNEEKYRKRVYISPESYRRLRLFAANYDSKQQQSLDTIILSTIDEKGLIYQDNITLDRETADILAMLASHEGKSIAEMVRWLCEMAQVYFNRDLSLAEALRPVSELKKELKI